MDDLKVRLSGEKPFNGTELRDSLDRIEKLEAALKGVLPAVLQLPGDVQSIYHDEIEQARATITSSAR